jgi:hypothetical protein
MELSFCVVVLFGWFCIAMGFSMVIALAPRLAGGSAIILDESGFSFFTLTWRWRRVAWSDVDQFSLFSAGFASAVSCRLRSGIKALSIFRQSYAPRQFVLPVGLKRAPVDVEHLMNEWRSQYTGGTH